MNNLVRCGVLIVLCMVLLLSGCDSGGNSTPDSALLHTSSVMPLAITIISRAQGTSSDVTYVGYTHQQADGNRLVEGHSDLSSAVPIDIPLDGEPRWLVAAPWGDGSVWVVVLGDGRVKAFNVAGGVVEQIDLNAPVVSPDMPPLLVADGYEVRLIFNPPGPTSDLTHPVILHDEKLAYIRGNGDLVVQDGDQITALAVNALPDARLLTDERGRVLVLTDPSDRYPHGILGDRMEATAFTLVETSSSLRVISTVEIASPQVIEGLFPIWTDMDGDRIREIIVTLSDAQNGSQVVVYEEDGTPVAFSDAIGRGNRWRHQLVVAPFGPNGELELADVITPHIGGTVEFFRVSDDSLNVVARLAGYSSHMNGSRNLDMAVAGDFDGDDRIELLVPVQSYETLVVIGRIDEGAHVLWRMPIGGRISTNIAAVVWEDGTSAIGIGHQGKFLRLWVPAEAS